jgi:hypothetical protein
MVEASGRRLCPAAENVTDLLAVPALEALRDHGGSHS